MALVELNVPDIGDFDEVVVIELLVQPGDRVVAEQSLVTVESDKASMEIPAPRAGTIRELKVALGARVRQGSPLALLEVADAAADGAAAAVAEAPPPAPIAAPIAAPAVASAAMPAVAPPTQAAPAGAAPERGDEQSDAQPGARLPHASPAIRKAARELGVPLAEVRGTGPNGRITLEGTGAELLADDRVRQAYLGM
jgi:pyruvate dehydrogenase E2 component (dihydrolipoamide acetyltransferase)